MSVFEITYDLRRPGRDYASLHAAIKSFGKWCHPLESTWLVSALTSAEAIRDKLIGHIDQNDGLLVTRLSGEAAWYGLADEVSKWLRQELSR